METPFFMREGEKLMKYFDQKEKMPGPPTLQCCSSPNSFPIWVPWFWHPKKGSRYLIPSTQRPEGKISFDHLFLSHMRSLQKRAKKKARQYLKSNRQENKSHPVSYVAQTTRNNYNLLDTSSSLLASSQYICGLVVHKNNKLHTENKETKLK